MKKSPLRFDLRIAQVRAGLKIEAEHKTTYEWLKSYFADNKKLPDEDSFYASIVADHLEEHDDYYTLLKDAGL